MHPKFVKTLAFPPLEFCPMDWLPDEVITNVLTHVVRVLPRRDELRRRDASKREPDRLEDVSALLQHPAA